MAIKMCAKQVKDSDKVVNAWFVVKIAINGKPQVFNVENENWFDFSDGSNGTLFKDKSRALKVVEKLCESNKKMPVFLVGCSALD